MKLVKIMVISLILTFYATPTYADEASIVSNNVIVHYHPLVHGHRCYTPYFSCIVYPDRLGAPCACYDNFGVPHYGNVDF